MFEAWKKLVLWWRSLRASDSLGKRGEREAERFLKQLGYVIVARGERSSLGEIDLVAVDGRTVVFIEVKTRASNQAGDPADAVDLRKQRRITRAAAGYLKRHQLLEQKTRFDVVAIIWPEESKHPEITHYKHAFEATDDVR